LTYSVMEKENSTKVSATFRWKPPSITKVDNYTIRVVSFLPPMFLRQVVADTKATIYGLEKKAIYNISVQAHNCGGISVSHSVKGELNGQLYIHQDLKHVFFIEE